MGRQIQLYLAPADVDQLEDRLKQGGQVVFVARNSPQPHPQSLPTCKKAEAGGVRTSCYLVRREDLDSVVLKHISPEVGWLIDDLRSPVVQFDGGFFDGASLRGGRLFYDTGYFAETGEWVEKPAAFLKWADSVLKLARKVARRDQALGAYVGSHAADWLARTGGQLED
jgi:hypothetical protein